MDVVFASAADLRGSFLAVFFWLAVVVMGTTVVVVLARPQPSWVASRRVLAGVGLGVLLLGGALFSAVVYGKFTRLTADDHGVRLRYEGGFARTRLLHPGEVESIVIGGGPGRGTWHRGCHVRFWLKGGGSVASARNLDMSKAQCQRLRADLMQQLRMKESAP